MSHDTSTQDEQWKPVVGFEKDYEVSDQGRVRSLDRIAKRRDGRTMKVKGRLRKLATNASGYLFVNMSINGNVTYRRVNRLVLESFVGPCPSGMESLHGNGIRTDNRLENLRWGTVSENQLDSVRHGTQRNTRKTHCPRGHELIPQNNVVGEFKRRGRSCLACARAKAYIKNHPNVDFEVEADRYYRAIMA